MNHVAPRAEHACGIVSLFSGIGGLDLGVRAGLGGASRTVLYVEREAFPAAVLAAQMEVGALDAAPIWTDVAAFDYGPYRGRVCGVVAGFPCPPVSVAGKRKGTVDARWLWPECVRALRETDADWGFFENVGGLLSANDGAAFGNILRDLAALGFDAEWIALRAFDAAPEGTGLRAGPPRGARMRKEILDEGFKVSNLFPHMRMETESSSSRLARLRALGNSVN